MVKFEPVWLDSLGAKSFCVSVVTPDCSLLIDPGVSVMHPSFPASEEDKIRWLKAGRKSIRKAAEKADVIVISHYHYDHFSPGDLDIYRGKLLLAKNPNRYINDSQRERAYRFFQKLYKTHGVDLKEVMEKPKQADYPNPLSSLPLAMSKGYGDYQRRREELLKKGYKWFKRRVEKWNSYRRIPEVNMEGLKVIFADGKTVRIGDTKISFSKPLFHGIEYSRVGWVLMTVVEYQGWKLIHSSDLNGPIIEDYAELIIKENPDILFLDGPMTYMLGYTLNRINLNRAVENAARIISETTTKLVIYDHHLPREPRFKEHTRKVWEEADRMGRKVITAAEYLGRKPAVLSL